MYEASPETGISEKKIINVPDGDKIQQAKQLKRQGYTQNEIADMLLVSQATISRWLKN